MTSGSCLVSGSLTPWMEGWVVSVYLLRWDERGRKESSRPGSSGSVPAVLPPCPTRALGIEVEEKTVLLHTPVLTMTAARPKSRRTNDHSYNHDS